MLYFFKVIKLKLLFKNTTKYSTEIYDEFLVFHSKKFSFRYNLFSFLISMIFLFFIILHIEYHNIEISFLLCIALTGFIVWRYFKPIKEVEKDKNSKQVVEETVFTFLFYEKFFRIYSKSNYCRIYYNSLYKTFETDSFFYIYLDHSHALLVDKSGFKKGSVEDFSKFMKSNRSG